MRAPPQSETPFSNTGPVDAFVGQRIAERRKNLQLTQLKVAAAIRMSVPDLEAIERGHRRIDPEKIGALATLLGVPVAYFFIGFEPPPDRVPVSLSELVAKPGSASIGAPALAARPDITIARYRAPVCLPLTVMQEHKLVEKHARAIGLGELTVSYPIFQMGVLTSEAVMDGKAQFAATPTVPFLWSWDRTRDNLGIKAIGALSSAPLYLVTRADYIHSVADFRESDRITVGAPKSGHQATLLRMAAAKAFGARNYRKLDRLTIGMPNPDAADALISGGTSADFNNAPFSYKELDTPGLHAICSSEELFGGPATASVLFTTKSFEAKCPKAVEAVTAALSDAILLICQDRRVAWESYRRLSEHRYTDVIERMIADPKIAFGREPNALMRYATFMRSTGALKNNATTWQDFFFPAAASDLHGD